MGVFPEHDANLPTQLWIAARYLESLSLLVAPFMFNRKIKLPLIFISYLILTLVLLLSIFHWQIFPNCFVEGQGLTPFKKLCEYIISIILVASIIFLYRRRNEFEPYVRNLLMISVLMSIIAELAFTFYISVYGLSNLIGHFLKIVSYLLIYKAIIETGFLRPYELLFRNLKWCPGGTQENLLRIQSLHQTDFPLP